jgi:hypothetical protein
MLRFGSPSGVSTSCSSLFFVHFYHSRVVHMTWNDTRTALALAVTGARFEADFRIPHLPGSLAFPLPTYRSPL